MQGARVILLRPKRSASTPALIVRSTPGPFRLDLAGLDQLARHLARFQLGKVRPRGRQPAALSISIVQADDVCRLCCVEPDIRSTR
jgi:hypothetical protein